MGVRELPFVGSPEAGERGAVLYSLLISARNHGADPQAYLRDLIELEDHFVAGEHALDGKVRPTKGALSIALEAKRRGCKRLLLPAANVPEATVIDGIDVYPVASLHEVWHFLTGAEPLLAFRLDRSAYFQARREYAVDFEDVKGQQSVRRALEVAVAGGHNLLMVGMPGTGKSMLAKRLPTIMPDMSEEEAIETTKVHSIAGLLDPKKGILTTRPFRAPHHTISNAGLLGGEAIRSRAKSRSPTTASFFSTSFPSSVAPPSR